MANLDFFAARDDLLRVLEIVFEQTDFKVFESYWRFGERVEGVDVEPQAGAEVTLRKRKLMAREIPDDS